LNNIMADVPTRRDATIFEIPRGHIRERWNGFYALHVHFPVAMLARSLRGRSRALRGKKSVHEQPTQLRQVGWSEIFHRRRLLLTETRKRDGNVSLGELAVLAQAAAGARAGSELIEIGTFDGRTTINLALNAHASSAIVTLDLPPQQPSRFQLDGGERAYVEKPMSGARLGQCRPPLSSLQQRITQLLGDSATFDWSSHYGKAGLVFVDGSHVYDCVRVDSVNAMRLVGAGGVVLWHDYGVWQGVTRALEDLERTMNLGLRHIRGTSLVVWRAMGR
jgi:Methyltransferase domain